MNKSHSFTKYQKCVIKFLGLLLDNERPFFYEKTKNNHLKVKIQGVDSILYTGGTPSDVKSISNFKAEVKRAIKAADVAINAPTVKNTQQNPKEIMAGICFEKLISVVIKQFRTSRGVIIQQEENLISEQKNLDSIKLFRTKKINNMILHTHKQQKNTFYLQASQIKALTEKISTHVDFILPTLADYKAVMNEQKKSPLAICQPNKITKISQLIKAAEDTSINLTARLTSNLPTKKVNTKNGHIKALNSSTSLLPKNELQQLMGIKAHKRLEILRQLSKSESLILIDEIHQAIAFNQEQSIEEVLTFIKDKDIPHELLMQHL